MSANKSFSTETSERYSRALFEVAKEAADLEKIETDIKNFKSLLENSSELKIFSVILLKVLIIKIMLTIYYLKNLNFSKNLKNFFSFNRKKKNIFCIKNYR